MNPETGPMPAKKALEMYFLDNRARLLEIASFLDRLDRYENPAEAKSDFRYKSLFDSMKVIIESDKDRTQSIQMLFSDLSNEPLDEVSDPKAYGAWKGEDSEGN